MYHPDTLIARQQEIELQGLEEGAKRYEDAQNAKARYEGFDRRDDVQKVIRGAVPLLVQALEGLLENAKGKRGRPNAAIGPLQDLPAQKVALIALSKTFHTAAKGVMLSGTAISIGRTIQVEIEADLIQKKDKDAAKRFLALAEGETSEKVTLKRHDKLVERLQVGLEWSQRTQALVGGTVLNLILTKLPGIFIRGMVTDERGTVPVVKIHPDALELLSEMAGAVAWTQPILRPMIVEPRKWTHYDTGAYLDYAVSRTVPLVRTFSKEHQQLVRKAIKDGSAQELLDGITAIQSTRFSIDTRVLDIVMWTKDQGFQPAKSFPLTHTPKVPERTSDEEWAGMTEEARKATSRRRKSVREIREAALTNSSVFAIDLKTAAQLSAYDAFYLPHSCDFRGRVYAVPHFNPQRSDHIKALFRFADTEAMGEDGGRWLAIHLGNCGDFKTPSGRKCSKATLDERVQWVHDNEAKILAVAQDPRGTYDYWSKADSPFCFLQACFEWAEFAASGYSKDFQSCVAIALDGSCSGLQHYSAMTRSEAEGYHVNLLPRDLPGDVYQVVADSAAPNLEAAATQDDPEGRAATLILAQGFGRSDTKRNVMTYFYGSAQFGMRDQHMVDTMRPLADSVALGEIAEHPYSMLVTRKNKDTGEEAQVLDGGFTCASVLAKHIYAGVVSVAPKADEAAGWFQQVASILAHESLPVIWRTPAGLPVVQRYSEYTTKPVNLWLYDRNHQIPTGTDKIDEEGNVLSRIQCLIREAPTKRINKKRARSAISPNVVHSLDAAHLIRTVVFAIREGIQSFQLIHDSFATHAGKTGRFFQIIREAFVDLYETYDPFEEIETYARSVLSEEGQEKLPPRPVRGTLDLRQVLASDYAFA